MSMQSISRLPTGLLCATLISGFTALSAGFSVEPLEPQLSDDSSDSDSFTHDQGFSSDDIDEYVDQWVYVRLPGVGNYLLSDIMVENSEASIAFDNFGRSLETFEQVSLITHRPDDSIGGVVVLVPPARCRADFDADGDVDTDDLVAFAQAFVGGHAEADLNGDGVIDVDDQFVFFDQASAGCAIPIV